MNTRRASPDALRQRLSSAGFGLEAIEGLPAFFRVLREPYPIGQTVEHWLGLFYLQQAATGLAAHALGARPGERILDLCAAPGGKASHIAELQQGSGTLVAGDSSPGRIRALVGNLYRLGHTGVLALAADGRFLPGGALFDRVLADVPCSGEGNPRRRRGAHSTAPKSESYQSHITGVQRALLRRAVELTRPGGTILYVTCTTSPDENERVVARALHRLPVRMSPIEMEVPHAPGLAHADGRDFPAEMKLAWRIDGSHLGSGTLFMARLIREEGVVRADDGWSHVPMRFPDPPEGRDADVRVFEDGLAELEQQMGVSPSVLRGARWLIRGDSVWLHSAERWPIDAWGEPPSSGPGTWQLLSLGLRAFRVESSGRARATNDLLRVLGRELTARTIDLGPGEMRRLLDQGDLPVEGFGNGYAAVRLHGDVVGRGFVRSGRLHSEIPRPQAHLLAEALRLSGAEGRRASDLVE